MSPLIGPDHGLKTGCSLGSGAHCAQAYYFAPLLGEERFAMDSIIASQQLFLLHL